MEKSYLGKTGLKVSKICFGSLTIGPLQKNMSIEEGGNLLIYGFQNGINFVDTAKIYGTYQHIGYALRKWPGEIIIATKSYDYTYEGMRESVNEALELMGLKSIDIFLLHEQESQMTFNGHIDGYRYLMEQKKKGVIKAIGISTHTVKCVEFAADCNEIDVIHPIINYKGIGIQDGTINEMECAIKKTFKAGKGIYGMKPLGGGNLINGWLKAMEYIKNYPYLHSIAIGMQYREEIDLNISVLNGYDIPYELQQKINLTKRELLIEKWCQGCGCCIKLCSHKALTLINNKVTVNKDKCVKCGYCSRGCSEFCIKII